MPTLFVTPFCVIDVRFSFRNSMLHPCGVITPSSSSSPTYSCFGLNLQLFFPNCVFVVYGECVFNVRSISRTVEPLMRMMPLYVDDKLHDHFLQFRSHSKSHIQIYCNSFALRKTHSLAELIWLYSESVPNSNKEICARELRVWMRMSDRHLELFKCARTRNMNLGPNNRNGYSSQLIKSVRRHSCSDPH